MYYKQITSILLTLIYIFLQREINTKNYVLQYTIAANLIQSSEA